MFCCLSDPRDSAVEGDTPKGPASEEEVKKSWPSLPETFTAEVAHASGDPGLVFEHWKTKALKVKAVTGGSAGKYNKANPDKALKAGDFIVKANGVMGDSKKIEAELKKKQKTKKVQILVSRGDPVDESVACRLKCAWTDEGTYYLNGASDQRTVQCFTLNWEWGSEKWWIHDAGDGYKRIQNQWTAKYLNWVEDGSGVALTDYDASYDSMLWKPYPNVSTSGAAKYQNKYKPDMYLNMESGSGPSRSVGLQLSPTDDYLSAQWVIEPFELSGAVNCRLQCAWTDEGTYYLNAANDAVQRVVQCYTLEPTWTSMMWWIHDADDGYKRIQNKWTGKYLNWVEDGSGLALTDYDASYDSMLWKPDPDVSTSGAVKYQNKYKPFAYLNMESGSGPSRTVDWAADPAKDYLSAQWLVQSA